MSKLPDEIERCLDIFVSAAKDSFGTDLVSVVLYGSAADGQLRATSDVNLLLVLKRFEQAGADRLREPMQLAHAAVRLDAMFLLESEIIATADAFAVKFADIASRHRLLFGSDPFLDLETPPDALLRRLKQVLLNLQLRLRERYVLLSLNEERLAQLIADAAPALRSSAASLLQLEGQGRISPKPALERIAAECSGSSLAASLQQMSQAREQGRLASGKAASVLMDLMQLTQHLRERADRLQQAA